MINPGKVIKNTGKTLLSIVCPPVGFMSWASKKNRFVAGLGGVFFSLIISMGIISSRSPLYDNPQLKIRHHVSKGWPNSIMNAGEAFVSPIVLYSHTIERTILKSNDSIFAVDGSNVVNFEGKSGRYSLNFDISRDFMIEMKEYSVFDTRERIQEYEGDLELFLSKGKIVGAREAEKNLESAKLDFEEAKKMYNLTYDKFKTVVNKMNTEIDSLYQ